MLLRAQKRCLVDYKQRHRRLRLLIRKLNKERKKQAQKIDILCNDFISAQRDFIKRLNTINFTANFYEAIVGITDLSSLLYVAGKLIEDEIPDSNVAFFLLHPVRNSIGAEYPAKGKISVPAKRGPSNGVKQDSFELYTTSVSSVESFESLPEAGPITLEKQHLPAPVVAQAQVENCFTPELVDNICKSNKLCTLDDMFAMGLQGNLIRLSKISAITVPLRRFARTPTSACADKRGGNASAGGSSLGFILIYRSSTAKLTPEELNNISAVTCGLSRAILRPS